jgi:hypothetical protein
MAKTFSVSVNKFPIKEGQESTLASEIQAWLDGLEIVDSDTVYSIEAEIKQGFLLVVAISG